MTLLLYHENTNLELCISRPVLIPNTDIPNATCMLNPLIMRMILDTPFGSDRTNDRRSWEVNVRDMDVVGIISFVESMFGK